MILIIIFNQPLSDIQLRVCYLPIPHQPIFSWMIPKKVRGAAGADYFILLTGACPLFGTFSAEDDIAKVTIFAGMQILKGCNGHFRQLINLCYFKK